MNERITDKKQEWKERYNERTVNCRGSRDQVSNTWRGRGSISLLATNNWPCDNGRTILAREQKCQEGGSIGDNLVDTGRWSPDIKSQIYATQMLKPHGSYKFFGLLGCRTSFETTHVNGVGDLVTTKGKSRQVLRLTFRKSKWVVETD